MEPLSAMAHWVVSITGATGCSSVTFTNEWVRNGGNGFPAEAGVFFSQRASKRLTGLRRCIP
jgi:hypothetical protein